MENFPCPLPSDFLETELNHRRFVKFFAGFEQSARKFRMVRGVGIMLGFQAKGGAAVKNPAFAF
jgi:hypothetical protein